ncbi:unnamed protein product [Menidia menidia]|uniref:(Atlantic silverside) hypothetical protein n=1 Tax=Menidia menidia TaxID=238744 RepID=A0A8S4AIU9_9TELE|nr:unnamed protein product [Menidia menidia]
MLAYISDQKRPERGFDWAHGSKCGNLQGNQSSAFPASNPTTLIESDLSSRHFKGGLSGGVSGVLIADKAVNRIISLRGRTERSLTGSVGQKAKWLLSPQSIRCDSHRAETLAVNKELSLFEFQTAEQRFEDVKGSRHHFRDDSLNLDLHTIYCHLYHMDVLSHLREHQLRSMCTSARYEKHEANHILFYPDSIATCWYILLSGSVFVKEHMYLARCCFGKQLGGRRGCECITLEPSEMIVVSMARLRSSPPLSSHLTFILLPLSSQAFDNSP